MSNHEKQHTKVHNLQTTKHHKKRKKSKQGITSSSNSHDHQPFPLLAFFANHIMQNISFISVTSHPTFQLGHIQIVKNQNTCPCHTKSCIHDFIEVRVSIFIVLLLINKNHLFSIYSPLYTNFYRRKTFC